MEPHPSATPTSRWRRLWALGRALPLLAWIASVQPISACRTAGPYGRSPQYAEIDEERAASSGAREYDPVSVARQPEAWRKGTVTLFGVVESRTTGPGGQALLKLSVRRLEPHNVCQRPADEDSCRVTVGDKDFGMVWALVSLRGDDDVGPRAVGQRSLVRVIGALGQDVSDIDGAPIVHATYSRHFPPLDYTTRAGERAPR